MTLLDIKKLYEQPWRFHHTWKHVEYIIDNVSKYINSWTDSKSLKEQFLTIIKYAAIFHDCVYDPKTKDNEEQSAKLWLTYAKENNIKELILTAVNELILSTKLINRNEYSFDNLFIVFNRYDWLDMGYVHNLTADYKKFLTEYEDNIRKEYSFVSDELYYKERSKFIKNAMNKSLITLEVGNFLANLLMSKYLFN